MEVVQKLKFLNNSIVRRAFAFSDKTRREGLLLIEDILDKEKIGDRDIFEYGMRFVVDGTDGEMIEKILFNIIKQEKDENMYILKTIQKEAVLGIQAGDNQRTMYALLNSCTDITIREDKMNKFVEDKCKGLGERIGTSVNALVTGFREMTKNEDKYGGSW
jgi:flagellar motor component MotA